MKEFLDITLLSVLQGVAEFLPVSSSGHLVIAQHALGVNAPGLRLDVFLHIGTLVSILLFYRARVTELACGLARGQRDTWLYTARLFLSILPALAVYALFKDPIRAVFENARAVGALLTATGLLLCATRLLPQGARPVTALRALAMGCAQALALLPGVSRSGLTLTAARAARVDPEAAAEFSFLMSAPLIAGAALLELGRAVTAAPAAGEPAWSLVLYGALLAAAVGYASLALLVRTLKGRFFWLFGPYCLLAGLATVLLCA